MSLKNVEGLLEVIESVHTEVSRMIDHCSRLKALIHFDPIIHDQEITNAIINDCYQNIRDACVAIDGLLHA